MNHSDYTDGLDQKDDPADFWDLADRAYETGAGK